MNDTSKAFRDSLPEGLSKIRLVVSDVDDTITTDGKLRPEALEAMWRLRDSGRRLILLSGGSAGWCDIYLRQWPVYMAIAESGAALLYRAEGEKGEVLYEMNPAIPRDAQAKRTELMRLIGPEKLSSDQYCRINDIAVDLAKATRGEVEEIRAKALELGAEASESSIHLNLWFGKYSKLSSLLSFMEMAGIDQETLRERAAYIGDSLNDEPLFEWFPVSFGVANVLDRKDQFKRMPAAIAPSRGGAGFAEIADAIIAAGERTC